MNESIRQQAIELLKQGAPLPRDWAREMFPVERREYELVYHGKDRAEDVLSSTMAVPLQTSRTFTSARQPEPAWENRLVFGDNLQVLKTLLEMKSRGQLKNSDGSDGVRLIYIDPPFATNRDFRSKSSLEKTYQDRIVGSQFIEFLRKRLILLRELLSDNGSLYLHLDSKKVHYVKVVLDEIFGESSSFREIIWKSTSAHSDVEGYSNIHETLLFYPKTAQYVFNPVFTEYSEKQLKRYKHRDPDGRRFADGDLTAEGLKGGGYEYEWNGHTKVWRCPIETMRQYEAEDRLYYTRNGLARIKRYLDEVEGVAPQDLWLNIYPVNSQAAERVDYPTQKPEALLERVIRSSSDAGDIVLDAFAGSGTTLAVAEKLDRRWIGIDCGKYSIYTVQKRMLNLRSEIGNRGELMQARSFTVYNAGLYDFSKLASLPWADWRFFALQLFGCQDDPHEINGLKVDGRFRGSSVLVFDHMQHQGERIDEVSSDV